MDRSVDNYIKSTKSFLEQDHISFSLWFLGFIWICKRIYVCITQRYTHDYLGTQSRLRKESQGGRIGGLENKVCLCMEKRNYKKIEKLTL